MCEMCAAQGNRAVVSHAVGVGVDTQGVGLCKDRHASVSERILVGLRWHLEVAVGFLGGFTIPRFRTVAQKWRQDSWVAEVPP